MSQPVNNKNGISPDHDNGTKGSLVIVGSGISAIRQLTLEASHEIKKADKVLYFVAEPLSELWIKKLNSNAETLKDSYKVGKHRLAIYEEMTTRILNCVRQGLDVCVVFYGHPGVFVAPAHQSIIRARNEGFEARMLPGISAEDCLFADLNVDPGTHGCQSFEATSFLLSKKKFDISSHLILWQIGTIGDFGYIPDRDNKPGLGALADYLMKYYGQNYEVVVYQASEYVICNPLIQHLALFKLEKEAYVEAASTLYVPPKISDTPTPYGTAAKLRLFDDLKPVDAHFSVKKLFRLNHLLQLIPDFIRAKSSLENPR